MGAGQGRVAELEQMKSVGIAGGRGSLGIQSVWEREAVLTAKGREWEFPSALAGFCVGSYKSCGLAGAEFWDFGWFGRISGSCGLGSGTFYTKKMILGELRINLPGGLPRRRRNCGAKFADCEKIFLH